MLAVEFWVDLKACLGLVLSNIIIQYCPVVWKIEGGFWVV